MCRQNRTRVFLCIIGALTALSSPAETWMDALGHMPLPPNTVFNRDNCIRGVLEAFQSNSTVRAIVFLPAVSDDFYLVNRNRTQLNARPANLGEAIGALTNLTDVRATFREGLLLLHLKGEPVEPGVTIKSERQAERLRTNSSIARVLWIDRHWNRVQPELASATKMRVVPAGGSKDAWHFARCNVVAYTANAWDLVMVASLSSGTRMSVESRRITFATRVAF
jgi:hypothetical protein